MITHILQLSARPLPAPSSLPHPVAAARPYNACSIPAVDLAPHDGSATSFVPTDRSSTSSSKYDISGNGSDASLLFFVCYFCVLMHVCINFFAWLNCNLVCILYIVTTNLYTLLLEQLSCALPHNYIHGQGILLCIVRRIRHILFE